MPPQNVADVKTVTEVPAVRHQIPTNGNAELKS
jgi:hypothetical protein